MTHSAPASEPFMKSGMRRAAAVFAASAVLLVLRGRRGIPSPRCRRPSP